jgi:hypothetical protein
VRSGCAAAAGPQYAPGGNGGGAKVMKIWGNKNSPAYAIFSKWFSHVNDIGKEFEQYLPNYYPFHESERSVVSILVAAAARAGFTPVAESNVWKKLANDPRKYAPNCGRLDLWMIVGGSASYAFEFKMSYSDPSPAQVNKYLDASISDARCLPPKTADHVYAGLISSTWSDEHCEHFDSLASGGFGFCFKRSNGKATYFHFVPVK